MASFLPGLRRAAPRLSQELFICHRCIKQSSPLSRQVQFPGKSTFSRTVRFNSTALPADASLNATIHKSSPLNSLSHTITNAEKEKVTGIAKKAFFPETSSKGVAYWLLGSAASVFGIVVFGGLTRLTESGYAQLLSPNCPELTIQQIDLVSRNGNP